MIEPLKLQVGKTYRTRDGQKTTALKRGQMIKFPFVARVDGVPYSWSNSGSFYASDPNEQSRLDLIAEWVENPEIKPKKSSHNERVRAVRKAIERAIMRLTAHGENDVSWLNDTLKVVNQISAESFAAGREAGLREAILALIGQRPE